MRVNIPPGEGVVVDGLGGIFLLRLVFGRVGHRGGFDIIVLLLLEGTWSDSSSDLGVGRHRGREEVEPLNSNLANGSRCPCDAAPGANRPSF